MHWNGRSWRLVPSPNTADGAWLAGVGIAPSGEAWAAGWSTSATFSQSTLVERWDGSAWSIESTPNPGTGSNRLAAIAVVASDDAWAVGGWGDVSARGHPLIEHWDGLTWRVVNGPNARGGSLDGIAAVTADDVWAVGVQDLPSGQLTVFEHWDGTRWSRVPAPAPTPRPFLFDISAAGSSDVWAVGYTYDGSRFHGVTEHWDGTSWSVVPDPALFLGHHRGGVPGNHLQGVAALSGGDVRAVGGRTNTSGSFSNIAERWDGTAWSLMRVDQPGLGGELLDAAGVPGTTDAWAVGYNAPPPGTIARPLIERSC